MLRFLKGEPPQLRKEGENDDQFFLGLKEIYTRRDKEGDNIIVYKGICC